jgi:hypothetical protein
MKSRNWSNIYDEMMNYKSKNKSFDALSAQISKWKEEVQKIELSAEALDEYNEAIEIMEEVAKNKQKGEQKSEDILGADIRRDKKGDQDQELGFEYHSSISVLAEMGLASSKLNPEIPVTLHIYDEDILKNSQEIAKDMLAYVNRHKEEANHLFCEGNRAKILVQQLENNGLKVKKVRFTGHWNPNGMPSFAGIAASGGGTDIKSSKNYIPEIGAKIADIVNESKTIEKVILSGCVTADLQKEKNIGKTSFKKIIVESAPKVGAEGSSVPISGELLIKSLEQEGKRVWVAQWLGLDEKINKMSIAQIKIDSIHKAAHRSEGQNYQITNPKLINNILEEIGIIRLQMGEIKISHKALAPHDLKALRKLNLFAGAESNSEMIMKMGLLSEVANRIKKDGVEVVGHPNPITSGEHNQVIITPRKNAANDSLIKSVTIKIKR